MKLFVLSDNRTTVADLCTEHGLSVYIETAKHRILLDTYRNKYHSVPEWVVGGFHLPDSRDKWLMETENELVNIANTIKKKYSETTFLTGHCTGNRAAEVFLQHGLDNLKLFSVGYHQIID